MKKMLGLLALTLAVSGVASADQDFLKSINFDTNVRYQYHDISGNEANNMGNEGFKQENRRRTRWLKTVSGTVVLSDEYGIEADFSVTHRNQTMRAGNERLSRFEYWNPSLTLRKDIQLGSLDTTFKLKYENETDRPKTGIKDGKYKTGSIFNEITFGPEFKVNLLGQNISVDTGVVYFKLNGSADKNLPFSANSLVKGKADGWGLNLNLDTDGTIAEGDYGKFTYGLGFVHKFRDVKGEFATPTGTEKAGTNVYLDYTQNVKYTTPTFLGGFYGQLTLQNEWEKHTSVTGWDNTFDVVTGLGYKTSFDTAVGEVSINPYTSYSVINRTTNYNKHRENNKRLTIERNEIKAGLKLGLAVK